jgi:hypothetical protein
MVVYRLMVVNKSNTKVVSATVLMPNEITMMAPASSVDMGISRWITKLVMLDHQDSYQKDPSSTFRLVRVVEPSAGLQFGRLSRPRVLCHGVTNLALMTFHLLEHP